GRHPLQTSDALGAAAAQLGPDAQAAVVELNKQGGLSHGKVTRCLASLFGIPLSRGGSVHTVLRAAARCAPAYPSIRQSARQSAWVVPDETGWRVGGHPAWLHTVVGPQATAYVIDPSRSGAVAEAILGLDYAGTMIHDGWSPYDRFVDAQHQQCLQHLLRRSDDMATTATPGAGCFPRRVGELLRAGLGLRDRPPAGEISTHGLAVARGRLENQLSDMILPPKTNAANERLAQHLWAHRDDLFTFLRQPGLDATNWRAELAIRFGVILRKVWGGSRTWAGARAQAVLVGVGRSFGRQGGSALNSPSLLRGGPPAVLALPPCPPAHKPMHPTTGSFSALPLLGRGRRYEDNDTACRHGQRDSAIIYPGPAGSALGCAVTRKQDRPLNHAFADGVSNYRGPRSETTCPATKMRWLANSSPCAAAAATGWLWRS